MSIFISAILFILASVWISFVIAMTSFAIIEKYHRDKLNVQIEIDKKMLYNQKEFQVFLVSLPKIMKEKSENIQ